MSNKVLYIGNYRDGTGWGNACLNNILAMSTAGIDVVPRAVTYEAQQNDYPERIKQLEAKSSYGCNVCIQHTLPHLYSYNANYKNIGFIDVESSPFRLTGWTESLNLMDEIWVPTEITKAHCRRSGVTKPIKIVPHPLDISKYIDHKPVGGINEIKDTFNFLFIGEFIERKNIKALIRAFHSEFRSEEPVSMVIKTSRAPANTVENYCLQVRNGLKLRKNYLTERVVSGRLDERMYLSIIKQCHSFVMPSRGEAFCIPALEAMACGVPCIWTQNTGMDDFAFGQSVESREEPCFGATEGLPYLDNAEATWYEIDLRKLQFAMRSAFMKWKTDDAISDSEKALEAARNYDHKVIGEKIKEILNDGDC